MGKNIEKYKRYMKKQELLGVRTFEFEINEDKDVVIITRYIPNNESERLVKIPDFVYNIACGTFDGVCQNIKLVGEQHLMYICIDCFNGNTIDLSNIDTSNVKNMSSIFRRCANLKELDLSNFDTSKVTNMGWMFRLCTNLEKLDLSNFDTSHVTDTQAMFEGCTNLGKLDLSNFDTSKVTTMGRMFYGCTNLEELDLRNFDTSNVKYKRGMFEGCESLKLIIANKDIKDWLVKNSQDIELPKDVKIEVKQ